MLRARQGAKFPPSATTWTIRGSGTTQVSVAGLGSSAIGMDWVIILGITSASAKCDWCLQDGNTQTMASSSGHENLYTPIADTHRAPATSPRLAHSPLVCHADPFPFRAQSTVRVHTRPPCYLSFLLSIALNCKTSRVLGLFLGCEQNSADPAAT